MMTILTFSKHFTVAVLGSLLALVTWTGCGGDSKVETEAKAVEQKAEQDFEQSKQALSQEVKEATAGFSSLADQASSQAKQTGQTVTQAPETATQAVPEKAQSQVAASMSALQKTLTEQLGAAAAAELENSLTALKQQASSALVNSQVDSLSSALGSGDVNSSLSSLSSLAGLAQSGSVNPVTLKDVISMSSASILSDSFSGGPTPDLISSAIQHLTDSKLFEGAKDLVQSLNSKPSTMTASQQGIVNDLIDSALPLLGSFGEQLQQLRQGQKAASDTKDAVDAIKGMF